MRPDAKNEILWKGVVKIDRSLTKYLITPVEYDGLQVYTIRDETYSKEDNAQFDNPKLSRDFPNAITIFVKGKETMEYMQCTVFLGIQNSSAPDIFSHNKTVLKGFLLEPLKDTDIGSYSCLGAVRFDNEESENDAVWRHGGDVELGRSLNIEKIGVVAFSSGSQGSVITFSRDQKKSVTIFFVASDSRPFEARIYTKRKFARFFCGNNGLAKEEAAEPLSTYLTSPPTRTASSSEVIQGEEDPLRILKARLARGELTIYEYEELRKVIEDKKRDSYTDWWA